MVVASPAPAPAPAFALAPALCCISPAFGVVAVDDGVVVVSSTVRKLVRFKLGLIQLEI